MLSLGVDDFLIMTFDSLRYDVAQLAWETGVIPKLAKSLSESGWERRHAPGSFTYASHAAYFAGFFPTPAKPGRHERGIGLRFAGSETLASDAVVFDAPDIVTGFRENAYFALGIGGVGFFNRQTPVSSYFPSLFDEFHWCEECSVVNPKSAGHQVDMAIEILSRRSIHERVLLFINLSAMHQPSSIFVEGAARDSVQTQCAALASVDMPWSRLNEFLRQRGRGKGILCSDHGTTFGEDGYNGHRLAHPVVWDVPYAEVRWGIGAA
ncbi:MAG: STM4013/SEN3800 family hydrolase [Planctomycetales bacterium]|nr:STM4013/SEN3800 family hydrolase [Planctomycetales bacterium]